MMIAILVLVTILACWGTMKNRRMGNKFGAAIGGLFSLGLIAITLLAIFMPILPI